MFKITVKILKGQEFYTGSENNNITSQDHRSTDLSFTFVDKNVLFEFFKPNKLKKIYQWIPVIIFNDRLPNTFDF